MENLRDMAVFVAVADKGSFAAAAKALSMSRPAVSRSIASLEEALEVQLLIRTTRLVTLSQVGATYLDDCRRILEMADLARSSARGRHGVVEGTLSITAPVVFGRLHVAPLLETFLTEHSEVTVRLALLDRVTHLEGEEFDVAIRIGRLEDTSQRALKVGEVRRVLVASPKYRARGLLLDSLSKLDKCALIAHRDARWHFRQGQRLVRPRMIVNDVPTCLDLARRGFGITQALSYQVGTQIAKGDLVEVLAEEGPPPIPVHVVLAHRERVPARTRAFVDHIVPGLRARAKAGWFVQP